MCLYLVIKKSNRCRSTTFAGSAHGCYVLTNRNIRDDLIGARKTRKSRLSVTKIMITYSSSIDTEDLLRYSRENFTARLTVQPEAREGQYHQFIYILAYNLHGEL